MQGRWQKTKAFLRGESENDDPVFLAEMEATTMKDPVMICEVCREVCGRVRKKDGFRCRNSKCGNYHKLIATDAEVLALKRAIVAEETETLWYWASSKNPKFSKPGSSVPAIGKPPAM